MSFTPQVHSKDAVFVQRDDNNTRYEQINISGSDAIVYLDSQGHIMVDKISDWATIYGIGTGGSGLYASYSISSSWASRSLSSSFIAFNGDRPIKRDDPDFEGLNVGGNNVVDFLENFFFPFVPATISINSGTTYLESGSLSTFNILGAITANDETVFPETTASIFKNGTAYLNPTITTGSYTAAETLIGTGSTSTYIYRTYYSVGNDGSPTLIYSSTKTHTYVLPYLYGTSTYAGLEGVSLYNALRKAVVPYASSKTASLSATAQYIYFCYPASYARLTSIKDPNLFEISSSFEYSASVSVTSSGLNGSGGRNWSASYKVYRTKLQSDPNGPYTFTY